MQPQFEDPHHLEWLIRRLSASSIWARLPFFGERPVRPWRLVLWFRRAPLGPVSRAFARGWAGSRYRAEKGRGEPILYYYVGVYLEAALQWRRLDTSDAAKFKCCHATRLTLPHDRRSLVCRAPLGLQRAAGLAESRWPAKRSLVFFFCFRDTAGRCAGRRGATQGGWGARKKGRAGLGRACRVGSRWACGCCLVAQEGLM